MDCFQQWRAWIRPVAFGIYLTLLLIALPLSVWELNRADAPANVQAWFVGGIFVMMTLPISLWGILQHLINYTQPLLQKPIIRVLWMVPIYALNAWFALMFTDIAIYLDTMRECYEAYVIYSFMVYLSNYLRSTFINIEELIERKPQCKHIFPFCCFPKWPMGRTFISRCKHGVLQYTVIRPLTTVISLCCELGGVYNEGAFDMKTAWTYLVVINNISQVWAIYCLVLFYRAVKEELKPIRPVPKFMCVKFVVFMSFWQSVLIAILANTGVIQKVEMWKLYDIKSVTMGIQDFLICIEMFLAAIGHYFSFSHKEFIDPNAEQVPCCVSFMNMWDVSDVKEDVIEHVRVIGKGFKRVPGRAFQWRSERTPLLSDSEGEGPSTRPRARSYSSDNDSLNNSLTQAELHRTRADSDILGTFKEPSFSDSLANLVNFESSYDSEDTQSIQNIPTIPTVNTILEDVENVNDVKKTDDKDHDSPPKNC